jgi:DNA helicase-2/ATP-dependent DNA helicase PcrA
MKFSKEQLAIENEIRNGNGNVAVQATAGSGKTTTLLQCLQNIPKSKKTIFLSFSKAIVEELKERVPSHVKACTLHSLGWGMVNNYFKGLTLDENKYLKLALKMFPSSSDQKKQKDVFKKALAVKEIVSFGRMTLSEHSTIELQSMCNYYTLDYAPEILNAAIDILKGIGKAAITTYDFTDLLYYPVIKPELITNKYDFILTDEAQDMNECQTKFVSLLGHDKTRFVFVGDTFQSIYGFMGSRVDSFPRIQEKFKCKVFSLPVSHRCPKNVVEFAQGVYGHIQYAEGAKDGDVRIGSVEEIKEGDMVLCRNTLPLIHCFFELLERNVKATIVGKDIASGLIEFAKQIGGYSFEQVDRNMQMMLEGLKAELKELGFQKPENHKKYGALVEKIQVMNLILQKVDSPTKLIAKINEIFHEDKKAAKLSSIHRSKGLQSERVFCIESFQGKNLIPSTYAEQDWELIQECNLSFVCYTRSQNELILIDA